MKRLISVEAASTPFHLLVQLYEGLILCAIQKNTTSGYYQKMRGVMHLNERKRAGAFVNLTLQL